MPATEEEPIFGWNSSGGRNLRRRKLLAGEKVEVNPPHCSSDYSVSVNDESFDSRGF